MEHALFYCDYTKYVWFYLDLGLLMHDAPQVGSYNGGITVWTPGNRLLPNLTNTSGLRVFPYDGPYGELGTILSLEGLS